MYTSTSLFVFFKIESCFNVDSLLNDLIHVAFRLKAHTGKNLFEIQLHILFLF